MIKENQPLTADADKMRALGKNMWYYKNRFLIKVIQKDNTPVYYVYNKYEDGKGKDLLWFTKSLSSVRDLSNILNEEIEMTLCTELAP